MSQDTTLADVTGHYHLYYNDILQNASPKRLRKFVDALNNESLKDMIEMYIKSMIEHPNYDKMTPFELDKKMIKQASHQNKTVPNANAKVLLLFKKYCSKKKRNNRDMYQNNSKLLSVLPMELMAHSLSYLTFKELSKSERTSLYFITASRKYKALSRGYLSIDSRFCGLAFTNRININLLSHFQKIDINIQYQRQWNCIRKHSLYWKILPQIVKKSQQTLQSLTINPETYIYRPQIPIICRLFAIVDCFPLLHTLHWTHERRTQTYIDANHTQITKDIQIKCPSLQNIGISSDLALKRKIFFMENNLCLLSKVKILDLDDGTSLKTNLIPFIFRNCKALEILKLKHFCNSALNNIIKEYISENDLESNASLILNKYNQKINANHHKSLTNLDLTLYRDCRNPCTSNDFNRFLIYLGLICVNLEEIVLKLSSDDSNIKWLLFFELINGNKNRYNSANKLKKISLSTIDIKDTKQIMSVLSTQLFSKTNFKYLEYFRIKINDGKPENCKHFITNSLVPFLNKHESVEGNLKGIELELNHIRDEHLKIENIYSDYYKPLISLLNNLPKSLKKLKIQTSDQWWLTQPKMDKRYEKYSMELVKCLIKLSSEKRENNLESIEINPLFIHNSCRKYLQFYFGYNNKYFHDNQRPRKYKYTLSFL